MATFAGRNSYKLLLDTVVAGRCLHQKEVKHLSAIIEAVFSPKGNALQVHVHSGKCYTWCNNRLQADPKNGERLYLLRPETVREAKAMTKEYI